MISMSMTPLEGLKKLVAAYQCLLGPVNVSTLELAPLSTRIEDCDHGFNSPS